MGMVRSPLRQAILVVAGLILLAAPPAAATAAQATSHELATATHAGPVAVTADGTAWFIPVRGSDWRGRRHSILGRVTADGTVSERGVTGFSTLSDIATGPEGGLWVSGRRGRKHHELLVIGHLSPTGKLLRSYTVGRGRGQISAMAVSVEAVWFIRERWHPKVSVESIESLSIASGEVHDTKLPLDCRAYALAIAADGTPWFTQKCGDFNGDGSASKTSISHLGPGGEIIRQWIAPKDYPTALAIGPEGTAWFAAWGYYQQNRIGRLTSSGELAEFVARYSSPSWIAVGPEGRLWFSSYQSGQGHVLDSIGLDGDLGTPVCADPKCALEPTDLTRAPDGSLWYGLIRPNYNTGGGGSGIYIDELIHNEAGFLGHLTP